MNKLIYILFSSVFALLVCMTVSVCALIVLVKLVPQLFSIAYKTVRITGSCSKASELMFAAFEQYAVRRRSCK